MYKRLTDVNRSLTLKEVRNLSYQKMHTIKKRKNTQPEVYNVTNEVVVVPVPKSQKSIKCVAHHRAGLDRGEVDVLRRAINGKYRSRTIPGDYKKDFC